MAMETIVCTCLTEITLSAHVSCLTCRREIYSTPELKDQARLIDAKMCTLRVESSQISVELYLRSIRRPSGNVLSKADFYHGVRHAPRGEKVGKEPKWSQAELKDLLEL
jgi:hypothetical protein